jgi:hypothetical protein
LALITAQFADRPPLLVHCFPLNTIAANTINELLGATKFYGPTTSPDVPTADRRASFGAKFISRPVRARGLNFFQNPVTSLSQIFN